MANASESTGKLLIVKSSTTQWEFFQYLWLLCSDRSPLWYRQAGSSSTNTKRWQDWIPSFFLTFMRPYCQCLACIMFLFCNYLTPWCTGIDCPGTSTYYATAPLVSTHATLSRRYEGHPFNHFTSCRQHSPSGSTLTAKTANKGRQGRQIWEY